MGAGTNYGPRRLAGTLNPTGTAARSDIDRPGMPRGVRAPRPAQADFAPLCCGGETLPSHCGLDHSSMSTPFTRPGKIPARRARG
ncbi:hypothetical protein GCM10018779_21890 [Streptomyces griseocarneus]|nr:hypothetical protein GCM10018779_21890 [Streptomyces griseocarneus]